MRPGSRSKWAGPPKKKKKPEALNKSWALRAQISWAKKRVENISKMSEEVKKDNAYLFKMSREMLLELGNLAWKLGDESLSMFISMLVNRLYSLEMRERDQPKRKKKRRAN